MRSFRTRIYTQWKMLTSRFLTQNLVLNEAMGIMICSTKPAIVCLLCSKTYVTCVSFLSPVNCQKLNLPDNVNVDSNETSQKTVVSFSCNDGYTLSGPSSKLCTSSGVWNNTHVPSCVADANSKSSVNMQVLCSQYARELLQIELVS